MKDLLKLKKFWLAVVAILTVIATAVFPEARAVVVEISSGLVDIINAIDWGVASEVPVEAVAE